MSTSRGFSVKSHCHRPASLTFKAHIALWAAVFVCLSAGISRSAFALDVWTEPNPGIRHLHRTTPAPAEFHALVIDLTVPGVSIRCTPLRERWKATSAYARGANLAAAINGGFWGGLQGAQGLAAGGGQVWSSDDADFGFFGYLQDRTAMVSRPSDVVEASRRGITDGVSGRPLIVDRSRVSDELHQFENRNTREPRSAVGVSEDGHRVVLVTVDGRRATSHGGTLYEMAELLIELGVYRGINLDGGGSTTMVVTNEGGVVNRPSRGWEREVVNHIGVMAPAPSAVAATTASADGGTDGAVAMAPRRIEQATPDAVVAAALRNRSHAVDVEAGEGTGLRGWLRARIGNSLSIDRLGLGQYREIVVPLFFLAGALVLFGTVFLVVKRVRRRRAKSADVTREQATTS
ncbi:MAG: phosphodiester glycosidase family protein [Deltaproteobacteria bacterium]|nr:phosphodiester glycosidase family protein [Deltaproteobacteria bacterium]